MPRTAVAVTSLSMNAAGTPTSVALDPTNGHSISISRSQRVVIRINNSAGGPKNVTFKAGDLPPSVRQGLGDLVQSVPAGATRYFVVESARFEQDTATIEIDLEAATTGTIEAVKVPKES